MKFPKYTYLALINSGLASCYGADANSDTAIKRVCKEVRECFRLKPSARLTIPVYLIPEGHYGYWDDRGTFVVDKETDVITAYAELAYFYKEVDPKRPLTSMHMRPVAEAYRDGGAAIKRLNEEKRAPIGETV